MSTTSRPFRLGGLLAAGLLSTAVLTGCGGDDAADQPRADAGDEKVAEASEKEEPEADLASGLLDADAFGPTAVVSSLSPEQLEQGAGLAASASEDLQVTPPECNAAVQGTQPDFDDFEDVAAVSAAEETSVVVEMLIRGGPVEGAADQLAEAAQRCPEVQISSPEFGQATASFENLPAPDLGDAAAVVRYTTVIGLPDGTQQSVPALLGAIEDGERLVFLMSLSADPAGGAAVPPDAAAFTALLEQAYETQAATLD